MSELKWELKIIRWACYILNKNTCLKYQYIWIIIFSTKLLQIPFIICQCRTSDMPVLKTIQKTKEYFPED